MRSERGPVLPAREDGGVLGQDGDPALAFQLVGIHDAIDQSLVAAEDAALAEHAVHQGRLAVVHVSDDGDVANFQNLESSFSQRIVIPSARFWREESAVGMIINAGWCLPGALKIRDIGLT